MPFTPSHAVVALPFVKTLLVPAAVAVGAMTPDLPLFVRGTPLSYDVTHDLRWLPVTMVVALALLLLWRGALRPAARELSPRWLAGRLPGAWDASAAASLRETFAPGRRGAGIPLLLAALALGVVTHVLWDAFTHEGRAGSALVPALASRWGPLPGYTWLQHGSSILGLAILAAAGSVWLRGRAPAPVRRRVPDAVRIGWWLSLPLLLLAAAVVGYALWGPFDAAFTPSHLGYRLLPPVCGAWAAATLVLCVGIQLRTRGGSLRPSPDPSRDVGAAE